MGTQYNVVVAPQAGLRCSQGQMAERIRQSLAKTNDQMSHYQGDSELNQLSALAVGEVQAVSPEMAEVLSLSEQVYLASDGAFDITIGPLVNLWGFGPKSKADDAVPSAAAIEQAKALTGAGALYLKGNQLSKQKPLELNLSAVAKGYGADRVSDALKACGSDNHLVEVGGEMHLAGISHRGTPWKIAVEKPSNTLAGSRVQRLFEVGGVGSRKGVATSGDYRNYFEKDGVRYSHTIDPRTGRPITHKLASVTVFAESSAAADAWATAISVLGPERGLAVAEAENLAVYMLVKTETGFAEHHSTAFATYVE
ncbi:MAG: FAD:protein FMN transferase [Cellvibrionaceae bacterium]|nr:FAD:protein FMN transferase [Cellvibrionaceae bacterium]